MTKAIGNRTFDVPKYKVTGYAYDGRICLETGDRWLVRMPPKYFNNYNNIDKRNKSDFKRARKYYDELMVAAILWQSVDSMSEDEYQYRSQKWKPKGAYGIISKKGLQWGSGVRGNNQHTPKEELARADPNNIRHGNKYPASKYNQWLIDGAKKERGDK